MIPSDVTCFFKLYLSHMDSSVPFVSQSENNATSSSKLRRTHYQRQPDLDFEWIHLTALFFWDHFFKCECYARKN